MSGYVYLLVNPSLPGLIKVGSTNRDPFARAAELQTTGVPTPFVVAATVLVSDAAGTERRLHTLLKDKRVSQGREFFRIDVRSALAFLVDVAEEQVKDVIMLPGPAQQIDEATKLLLPGPDYNAARAEKLLTALATDGSGKAAYVLGMHLLNQPQVGRASLNRGIKYLEQAVAADVVDAYYALASHGRLEYLAGYFAKESDQQKAKDRATEIFIQHLKNDTAIDVQLLNPVVLKNLASITRRLTEMHTAILNTGTSSHAERVAFSLKYLNFILFLTTFRFFEYMSFYEASDLPYEFGLSIGKKIAVDFKKTYYGKNQRWIDHVMDDALYDNILRIKFIEPTIDDLKFL